MSPALRRSVGRPWFSIILGFAAVTGCATMPAGESLPFGSSSLEPPPEPSPAATCSVELRTRSGRSETIDVPLAEDTRVQDVLDASKATSKYRNLDVFIMRPTPNASEPVLKLDCRFDRRTRRMGWESDYALLPGDRVVVREAASEGLDKVLGSLLGPVLGGR